MQLSLLATTTLVGLALLAAACGGSENASTTTLNISQLGSGSTEAFVACSASEDCGAIAEACTDSGDCLGGCPESGECTAIARVVQSEGTLFGCVAFRFAPSAPETQAETETGQETNTEGETATLDGETPPVSGVPVPVDCIGPVIELSDLDLAAVGQLQRSPDGKVAWSDTPIRISGRLEDGVLRVTTVEP
jgi:hypothetical protein